MKSIRLSGKHSNKVVLLDDEYYDWACQFEWYGSKSNSGVIYANALIPVNGKTKCIVMHKALMPEALLVDHRDGNGLNNQKSNLRKADKKLNGRNIRHVRKGFNRYVGVYPHGEKFMVRVSNVHHGCYHSEKIAALVSDHVRRVLWKGEGAALYNFPDERLPRCFLIPNFNQRAKGASIKSLHKCISFEKRYPLNPWIFRYKGKYIGFYPNEESAVAAKALFLSNLD